jgi:hypothetical protein
MTDYYGTLQQFLSTRIQCIPDYFGIWSRDNSFAIAMSYRLYGRGSRWEQKIFLYLTSVQTGSGAHSASYPMDTGVHSAGLKGLGREADHSPPSSAEAKNDGAISSLPHTSSLRGALMFN